MNTTTTTTPCAIHNGITLPDGRVLGFNGEEFPNGVQVSEPDSERPAADWRVKSSVWRTTEGQFTHRFNGDPAASATITCDPAAALSAEESQANAAAATAFLASRREEIKARFLALGRTPAAWAPAWLQL